MAPESRLLCAQAHTANRCRGHWEPRDAHPALPADALPRPPLPYLVLLRPRLGHGHHYRLLGLGVDPAPHQPPRGPPEAICLPVCWSLHLSRMCRAAVWGREAPPGQGRAAFYAPSRVNQDWDGPFPTGLPVCVLH